MFWTRVRAGLGDMEETRPYSPTAIFAGKI